jgi:hypothetical protein
MPYREYDFRDEISLLYEEDMTVFDNSVFYVAKENDNIVASAKVTLWNNQITLPIEKLFNIDIENIFHSMDIYRIWHVGRFAISRGNGVSLLKKLLTLVISKICNDANSVMVAECDKKFVRALNMMNIKTETLAPSVYYLGSETLPIYATNEWLGKFLETDEVAKKFLSIHSEVQKMSIQEQGFTTHSLEMF